MESGHSTQPYVRASARVASEDGGDGGGGGAQYKKRKPGMGMVRSDMNKGHSGGESYGGYASSTGYSEGTTGYVEGAYNGGAVGNRELQGATSLYDDYDNDKYSKGKKEIKYRSENKVGSAGLCMINLVAIIAGIVIMFTYGSFGSLSWHPVEEESSTPKGAAEVPDSVMEEQEQMRYEEDFAEES
mmetsp:Transcript_11604/g.22089  ORF Transcript_11604/g.22089 Transcript_11604/m.22089 type:complete len:186 (-) Transcript_11604:472-1029(-)